MKFAALLLSGLLLRAQLTTPNIGWIASTEGGFRAIDGVHGAFVLRPREKADVRSLQCSAQACLEKLDREVRTPGGSFPAPPGPMLAAFDGQRALLHFPETGEFAWLEKEGLAFEHWHAAGEVLSFRATSQRVEIAIRDAGIARIVTTDGGVISTLDTAGPVLLDGEGILYATESSLLRKHENGQTTAFELPGVRQLFLIRPGYAGIRTAQETFVLHQNQLFQLPEAAE